MKLEEFGKQLDTYRDTTPEEEDRRIESACIGLLARLEQKSAKLELRGDQLQALVSIEFAKEILVEILEFIHEQFGSHIYVRDLSKICELRDRSRQLEEWKSRQFWKNLFRANRVDRTQFDLMFQRLVRDFIALYESLFGRIERCYQTAEKAADWKTSYGVFTEELMQRW